MFQKVKGFRDVFGEEIPYWNFVEEKISYLFNLFGYSEFKLPILEKIDVFDRGIGGQTDIVEKEMFAFKDRNDEILALRPEGTASLVRAFIENKLYNPPGLKKYYYYGPMFRRERPQKGRFRQFTQAGVEVFGSSSPLIDADVINLLKNFFEACGVMEYLKLEINSVGCGKCRPSYKEMLVSFLMDKKDNLCEDCKRRLVSNPLRVLDCKIETCKEVTVNSPVMLEHLCEDCLEHFGLVKKYLTNFNIDFTVNPKIVRGLDYYVNTAFEMVTDKLGASSAVGAGGRYDGLVKTLGGPDVPGIGFAVGVDRLVSLKMLSGRIEEKRPDVFGVIFKKEQLESILPIFDNLRKNGINVDFDYDISSIKSQMKKADRAKVRFCLIFGEAEFEKGHVTIKDMKSSNQKEIPISEISKYIECSLEL